MQHSHNWRQQAAHDGDGGGAPNALADDDGVRWRRRRRQALHAPAPNPAQHESIGELSHRACERLRVSQRACKFEPNRTEFFERKVLSYANYCRPSYRNSEARSRRPSRRRSWHGPLLRSRSPIEKGLRRGTRSRRPLALWHRYRIVARSTLRRKSRDGQSRPVRSRAPDGVRREGRSSRARGMRPPRGMQDASHGRRRSGAGRAGGRTAAASHRGAERRTVDSARRGERTWVELTDGPGAAGSEGSSSRRWQI